MLVGTNPALVERLYLNFCEAESGINHPLQEIWDDIAKQLGPIESDSLIDTLFYRTIQYVIDSVEAEDFQ